MRRIGLLPIEVRFWLTFLSIVPRFSLTSPHLNFLGFFLSLFSRLCAPDMEIEQLQKKMEDMSSEFAEMLKVCTAQHTHTRPPTPLRHAENKQPDATAPTAINQQSDHTTVTIELCLPHPCHRSGLC